MLASVTQKLTTWHHNAVSTNPEWLIGAVRRLNGQCGASLACKSPACRVIGSLCFEEGSGGRSRPMRNNDTPQWQEYLELHSNKWQLQKKKKRKIWS